MSVRQYECKFSHLLHNIEDVGLQLLRSVCSHPEVQLQVIGVTFECLTYTCDSRCRGNVILLMGRALHRPQLKVIVLHRTHCGLITKDGIWRLQIHEG